MEKERLPLYAKSNFNTRISRVAFGDEVFVIKTSKDKHINHSGSFRYYYALFYNGEQVCSCHVSVINSSVDYRKDYIAESMRIKPRNCLEIISIESETLKDLPGVGKRVISHKGKGYGSVLLNFVIGDVLEFSNYFDKLVPIIFDRRDTPEATAFYNKFSAIANINSKVDKLITPMIIENPSQIPKYTGRLISEEYLDDSCGYQPQ